MQHWGCPSADWRLAWGRGRPIGWHHPRNPCLPIDTICWYHLKMEKCSPRLSGSYHFELSEINYFAGFSSFCVKRKLTYLIASGNLQKGREAALSAFWLLHVLLGLHACVVVVVRCVQEGFAKAGHELWGGCISTGATLRLQNVLCRCCHSNDLCVMCLKVVFIDHSKFLFVTN